MHFLLSASLITAMFVVIANSAPNQNSFTTLEVFLTPINPSLFIAGFLPPRSFKYIDGQLSELQPNQTNVAAEKFHILNNFGQ